jgi:hypothetical protein
MPLEHLFVLVRPYGKAFLRVFLVSLTIIAVLQLFHVFTRPDRTRWAINTQKSEQSTLAQLHRLLVEGREKRGKDELMVTNFLSYAMCGLSGATCTDKLDTQRAHGTVGEVIANVVSLPLAHPPASGVFTIQETLANAGFIPKTYAQGIGFSSLSSFRMIWKSLRDVVFLLIVLAVVITGFIVMFNVPVGGKTSVAIESILPRLVITLIAISLSYAIAGLLIDLMYVLMFLVVTTLNPILTSDHSSIIGSFTTGKPMNLFEMMFTNGTGILWLSSQALYAIIPSQARYVIDSVLFYALSNVVVGAVNGVSAEGSKTATAISQVFGDTTKGALNNSVGGWTKGILRTLNLGYNPVLRKLTTSMFGAKDVAIKMEEKTGGLSILGNTGLEQIIWIARTIFLEPIMALFRSFVTVVVLFLLVLIAFLISIAKTFWLLMGTYVSIVLMIMFAPLYIALNALPGNNSFMNWIKQLSILLLTFPLVLALLLVALFFMQSPDLNEMWTPPFVAGIASQQAIQALIAGTLLFNIPKMITKVRESLGYKEGFSMSPLSMISPWIGLVGGITSNINAAGQLRKNMNSALGRRESTST